MLISSVLALVSNTLPTETLVATTAVSATALVFVIHKQVIRYAKIAFLSPLALVGMAITDGTVKQDLSISQQLLAIFKYGLGKYLPLLAFTAATIDVSGQTTEVKHVVFVGITKCYAKKAYLISDAALAASDTNYITIVLKNTTDSHTLVVTGKTTKATGGAAIVAKTPWEITLDQYLTVHPLDVIELSVTPATNSVANDLTNVKVLLGLSYDEDDASATE
jgi:hypothetical protein